MSTYATTKRSSRTQESTHPRSRASNAQREAHAEIILGEAANTAVYLMNRCTTSGVHDLTPYEKFYGKKPDLSHVRIFGSIAYVHIPDEKRQKLDPKSEKCILIGYSLEQKGYKCYNPSTRKVRVSRDVVFDESASWYAPETTTTPTPLDAEYTERGVEDEDRITRMFEESPVTTRLSGPQEPLSDQSTSRPSPKLDKGKAKMPEYEDDHFDGNESTHSLDSEFEGLDIRTNGVKKALESANEKLRRSAREKNPVSRFGYDEYMAYHYAFMMKVATVREPETFSEAAKDPRWIEAMNEEMRALRKNETWDLVPHSPHRKAIGCRWIYKVKYNADGSVNRYKARLVAKGYAQTHGVDYEETFAPVAKMTTVRTVTALAAAKGWHLHQIDIKNAFLQGELEEEVYMVQPPGFESSIHPKAVCRLKKPLYGLKQAPRAWHSKITQYLHQIGFRMSKSDNSLYIRSDSTSSIVIILYVDDLVIGGENLVEINKVKSLLSDKFEMTDMKELHYFLGIEVIRTPAGIIISQRHYILNLLYKFGMTECKSIATPLDRNLKLDADSGAKECEPTQYRQLIGSLIYLTITRPDLSYPVGLLSQFMQTPRDIHFDCAKRILRYVSGTMDYGILYKSATPIRLEGYTDADWAGYKADRRSTSGFVFSLGSGAISWSSKKQPTVALSSTEAEYRGAAVAACEAVWLKRILKDLGVPIKDPTPLYCDNLSSIHLARNPVFHARTKHIEVHYHFIRERVQAGDVNLLHINTNLQTADIFTKALGADKLRQFMSYLGLVIPDLPSLRGSTRENKIPSEPGTSRSGQRRSSGPDTSRSGHRPKRADPS